MIGPRSQDERRERSARTDRDDHRGESAGKTAGSPESDPWSALAVAVDGPRWYRPHETLRIPARPYRYGTSRRNGLYAHLRQYNLTSGNRRGPNVLLPLLRSGKSPRRFERQHPRNSCTWGMLLTVRIA